MSDVPAEIAAAQRRHRKNVQIALRQMCHGPDGKLSKNARLVMHYLAGQCNGTGELSFPRDAQGQIDQTAMVRMAGRREVFDLLARLLAVNIEERHNLKD